MKTNIARLLTYCAVYFALTLAGATVNAGTIDGSSILLDDANATQLESWIGQGDLDWESVWYGASGEEARVSSWHEAVDGVGATVSIYSLSYQGDSFLVGGYTQADWGAPLGYQVTDDESSFIFNLGSNEMFAVDTEAVSKGEIYANPFFFATFGRGFDLYGGTTTLGQSLGYSFDRSYSMGPLNGGQLVGVPFDEDNLQINALETFTFASATTVTSIPEPGMFVLMLLGIVALKRMR